ncbi:MAG: BrnT family toxin [Gammaproteobacteria bacterium]|nr:BrnT family toxin [Gammaproteobacteria bacterium]MBU1655840.1 BrnT family toxin [Gammaproteobacteria bacterium]MBU1961609.1 BrnT family toxin [Gammaproteobacteria bacterium]
MQIRFDPAKDLANIAKHGLSLRLAKALEWDLLLAAEDDRDDYGEQRFVGFAPIGRTVYCLVFTQEDECYRIISLRKAEPREVRYYARHI